MPASDRRLEIAKEELRIVRKFLRRNKIEEMCTVLQMLSSDLNSAKVVAGSIPAHIGEHNIVPFQDVVWDSDGYFDDGEPTRLTVPTGLGGRYFVQVAVRWLNPEQSIAPPPDDQINDSYYYSFVALNGADDAMFLDARATASKVGFGATGTTQHFTFDVDLSEGDFIELHLWQEFFDPVRADMAFSLRRLGA